MLFIIFLGGSVGAGVIGGEDGEGAGPTGGQLIYPGVFWDEEGFEVFGSDHVVSLFFQRFGDKVGVGGALGGVFAAVEAVWVVNTAGTIFAAVLAEGVGGGVKVERVGAIDTEEGAVLRNQDGRVRLGGWRREG